MFYVYKTLALIALLLWPILCGYLMLMDDKPTLWDCAKIGYWVNVPILIGLGVFIIFW